ncbi:MAG: nucleotidyltransferase family protein [Gammaproteobacteria bacterium]|nr:nucleotidyltransferase family protein [Gammaproteobacteria bacterium]
MPKPHKTVFAVVLAAGMSTRFGATKQVAKLDGVPIVQRAVQMATRVCGDRVITVIGHDASSVLRCMHTNSGFVVVNDDYQSGLGSSIAAAARACPEQTDALLVLLADQVLITESHLNALLECWSGTADEIVATAYAGTDGPPVLMPKATFADLRRLRGDTGARALFQDPRFRLQSVPFEDAAVDIDTPADLDALA